MTVAEQEIDVLETYRKSWDAFLDAYQMLQTEKQLLDSLCLEILATAKRTNPKWDNYKARYTEITGKEMTNG